MGWADLGWIVGGYLVGTIPSTLIVARTRGATDVVARARRQDSGRDAHILITPRLGIAWSIVAGTFDVVKAFLFVLAAREWGHASAVVLASVGAAVVVGYTFPFYARQMAGRGLAASAGVLLVLLPAEMVVAGVLILVGAAVRVTGWATTVAMASVPGIAAAQGQPAALVAMAGVILAVMIARRIEGMGDAVRAGMDPMRVVASRALLDRDPRPTGRPSPSGARSKI